MSYTMYAIKHLPSGGHLPWVPPSRRPEVKLTHIEPTHEQPPRLFVAERDAKVALGRFCKGTILVDDEGVFGYEDVGRKRDDFAIVPWRLSEA